MIETPPPRSAAIYTRISRDKEGEENGVRRQRTACEELAKHLNLDVVAYYSDNDVGASKRTNKNKLRTEYPKLLADAYKGHFSTILAYSNSRLTRRMKEFEELVTLFEETGVEIRTMVSGDDDLATADGQLTARIKASVDVAESDRISERQKAAFRDNALQGKPKLTHQRPFGWQKDGITLDAQEAALIRAAIKKVIAGASITATGNEWEAAGIRTAADKDTWPWTTVRNVLVGWRTVGVRTYNRVPMKDADGRNVMGSWAPIISPEDREAALAALANRSLKKKRQGK
jgi:site-specific DNA recombinase